MTGARLPVLVLVGRPNVGKSTLFNRLTATRDALVADLPGLTRDRQYGYGRFEDRRFIVVDTGGLVPASADPLAVLAADQARIAIQEADVLLFVADAREGLNSADELIARELRKAGKPIRLLVNKAEGLPKAAASEFFRLGMLDPHLVSAEHGEGIDALLRELVPALPPAADVPEVARGTRVAIVGRPNVGKSTLVNRLLGEERVLAGDQPGTTRDAIAVPFRWRERDYVLVDTAGVRRRAKVTEVIEKFSVVKTLQAIEEADVVVVLSDAQSDIGVHDARLMGLVAQRGRGMILAINKWDGLGPAARERIKSDVDFKLPFLDFVPVHFISARHGSGLGELMTDVDTVHTAATRELPTPELTRALEQAVDAHQPPAVVGRRIKLRYAHQGGRDPPVIVVHGNQTERLPQAYKRYLVNRFREAFQLTGVPLALEFRTGENPFKGRPNPLTGRQRKKRQRLIARHKK